MIIGTRIVKFVASGKAMYMIPVYLFLTLAITIDFQAQWKKEVDWKGVQIYTRFVEGYPIKAFKATSTINASLDQILEILIDIEGYSEWVANCRATTLLSVESETSLYFHMEIDAPFPAEDRDLVQGSEIVRINDQITQLVITNYPEMLEPNEGMIRMPRSDGKWILTQINDSTTFAGS